MQHENLPKIRIITIGVLLFVAIALPLVARGDTRTYKPPPRSGTIYVIGQFRPYKTGDVNPKTKVTVNWGSYSRTENYGRGMLSIRIKLGFVIRLQHKSNDSVPLFVESEGQILRIEQLDNPPTEWSDSRFDKYTWGSCGEDGSIVGSLTQFSTVLTNKIPLILIHGNHGTGDSDSVTARTESYWKEFVRQVWNDPATGIGQKYELFIFKYCSDRVGVKEIADAFGRQIDEKLNDRPHVILAHSMGGLIAKSYMVGYRHSGGIWKGKLGGESVLGLIALATPHHGTPGANNPLALARYFPSDKWREQFEKSNFLYWLQASNFKKAPAILSNAPNRSDLRWDNYDGSISIDQNEWLSDANSRFKQYSDRVILYAGALKPMESSLSSSSIILDKLIGIFGGNSYLDDHALLSYADGMLHYGLGKRFGYTDGLVPFKSAMLCDFDARSVSEMSCSSRFRTRRFEFGDPKTSVEIPNEKTLSITRTPGGFDHKEMYENGLVFNKVVQDLVSFVPKPVTTVDPSATVPVIPTLFLIDVSGSMKENDKIGQARVAGLDALREMRTESSTAPPISLMTFAGDCNMSSTKRMMPFSPNFTLAENTMRSITATDDMTPLPQARDVAINSIIDYIDSNPAFKQGRIILLSDGQSTCGEIRPPGVFSQREIHIGRAKRSSQIKFFTIGFDIQPGSIAERDLQFLASETGGRYYNAANRTQLISSFRKQVRSFIPRPCNSSNSDFSAGLKAFSNLEFLEASKAFESYLRSNTTDFCGYYNLALAYEASDRYKKAALNYRKYLTVAPTSPDRSKIEAKIAEMNNEYAVQFDYYIRLLISDLEYLNGFYKTVFDRSSADLASEFDGFVYEKRDFYANLPDILEIDARWLLNDARDISTSIDTLAKRRKLESFDRDAISLLTIPISQIEDMIERLRNHQRSNLE